MRDDYKQFPDDEKFTTAFVSRDIYNMRSRNFILSHLENYDNKAPIIIENYTIEHIIPQNANLSDEWNEKHIKERAEQLADKAKEIWVLEVAICDFKLGWKKKASVCVYGARISLAGKQSERRLSIFLLKSGWNGSII